MTTDPIADLLTQIRNALAKQKPNVVVPHSKVKQSLVALLKEEGYLSSFFVSDDKLTSKTIDIKLKYHEDQPVIKNIRRISKPGQRIYSHYTKLPRVLGGLGMAIISTSQGLMTNKKAKQLHIGGEIICEVY
ncbi:MAG: 30S ribosomal protein S8 [Patescibacteria group bacterium]